MYEAGKAAEMNGCKMSLHGLCEVGQTQSGQVRLSSGETILFSGHKEEDTPLTVGFALMLTKEAQLFLISLEEVCSRIITDKFWTKMKNINTDVVQSYSLLLTLRSKGRRMSTACF